MTPKWIEFEVRVTGLTNVWNVVTRGHRHVLGAVEWYPPWRKYAFHPAGGMVFEQTCLRDIATFCEDRTNEHRANRRAALRVVLAAEEAR